MARYVAFLRGINVGGNKTLKMADLKKAFESLGYKNVKTVLASGNVIFEAVSDNQNLSIVIEQALVQKFKMSVGVVIRSVEELQKLSDQNPFANIALTTGKTLYITFLDEKSKSKLKLPYDSADKSFKIIANTGREVLSIVDLAQGGRTVDLMKILDKEFGKSVTTRNWNTIAKILA